MYKEFVNLGQGVDFASSRVVKYSKARIFTPTHLCLRIYAYAFMPAHLCALRNPRINTYLHNSIYISKGKYYD